MSLSRGALAVAIFCFARTTDAANAYEFPAQPNPTAPFPNVIAVELQTEPTAPGIVYAEYRLFTAHGPLAVHAVALDMRAPGVHCETVLASDHIVSNGETVSSMATRSSAVAGINGDYFDIANTFSPLGIVVRDGKLQRTPSARVALAIARNGEVRFAKFRFHGEARFGAVAIPLALVNQWPPPANGAALLTPAFGKFPIFAQSSLLQPLEAVTPFGAFRAAQGGYLLALGARAFDTFGTLAAGDAVQLSGDTEPSFGDLRAAIGGGPQLLSNAAPYVDPEAPAAAEGQRQNAVSGAARTSDGTLLLVQADARNQAYSVGLNRAEFTALLRSLGALDAIALDGGGSSTLVARQPGDERAAVRNLPSDGKERPVGDALLVYSSAGGGAATALVVRPAVIRIERNTAVTLAASTIDAGGRPRGRPSGVWSAGGLPGAVGRLSAAGIFQAGGAGSGVMTIRIGRFATRVPVRVFDAPARLVLTPSVRNPLPGELLTLSAVALDRAGFPIESARRIAWSATTGTIDGSGRLRASRDTIVSAELDGVRSSVAVWVGRHSEKFLIFGEHHRWSFVSAPPGGSGEANVDLSCSCLRLRYDFTTGTRAAYAKTAIPLPQRSVGFSVEVFGDRSNVALRAAVKNDSGETIRLTLSDGVAWSGWKRLEVLFPVAAGRGLTLDSLYVLNGLERATVRTAGTLALRDFRLLLAGSH